MKKLLIWILSALLLCACAWAEEMEMNILEDQSGQWRYVLLKDGTAQIFAYDGNDTEIIIPPVLDGHAVTAIGEGAFAGGNFVSIGIPDSVTSIGAEAFNLCESLESILLPEGLTSIGDRAFGTCCGLTSITIPDGVRSIGEGAFTDCDGLTSITIPNSVTEMDGNPFITCAQLTDIRVAPDHPVLEVIDGVLFRKRETFGLVNGQLVSIPEKKLICYPEALTAEQYIIPGHTRYIAAYAFYGCKNVKSVQYLDRLECIGKYAFSNSGLIRADIWDAAAVEESAFSYCIDLNSLSINASSIGDYAFEGCWNLSEVRISNGLKHIGQMAFFACSRLTSITIPDSVESMGFNPFLACGKLNDIYVSPDHPALAVIDGVLFDKNEKKLICYPEGKMEKSYAIPKGIRSIGNFAFCDSYKLYSVTIPRGLTTIGAYAFYECDNLSSMVFPETLTEIGECAFCYCSGLGSVVIPESVTKIDASAFQDCSALNRITVIRNSYASRWAMENGFGVMYGKRSGDTFGDLTYRMKEDDDTLVIVACTTEESSLEIPEWIDGRSVTEIGEYAFEDCDTLERVTLPSRLRSIADNAFTGCGTIMFTVERNSYAAQWCRDNRMRYTYPDANDWLLD